MIVQRLHLRWFAGGWGPHVGSFSFLGETEYSPQSLAIATACALNLTYLSRNEQPQQSKRSVRGLGPTGTGRLAAGEIGPVHKVADPPFRRFVWIVSTSSEQRTICRL